jgi:hypothetical protein
MTAAVADHNFRLFDANLAEHDPIQKRVLNTYKLMHTNQTVDFVREQVGVR